MRKIQVFLREDQKTGLRTLSERTGLRQSDLVRRSVDLLLENESRKKSDWQSAIRAVAGIWRDYDEIETIDRQFRESFKKRFAAAYRRK